jgi:hypothetical protein
VAKLALTRELMSRGKAGILDIHQLFPSQFLLLLFRQSGCLITIHLNEVRFARAVSGDRRFPAHDVKRGSNLSCGTGTSLS